MPHQLEGFKIAETVGTPLGHLTFLVLLSSLLGAVDSFVAFLTLSYRNGPLSWFATDIIPAIRRMVDDHTAA